MKPYKCLIVGLGDIGLKYDLDLSKRFVYTHARAISIHPDFELIGAVDINKKNRDEFKKNYRKPVFANFNDASSELNPDLIIISSPTKTHKDVLEEILKKVTPLAILCEKPLDIDIEKARKIVNECYKNNIKLYVNYIRRSDPGSIKVGELLKKEIFKKPYKGIVWYSKGLKNNGSHFINLLECWLGHHKAVKNISKGKQYKEINDFDYDFTIQYRNAEILFCSSIENSSTYNSIEIMSPTGRLLYENGGEEIFFQKVSTSKNNYLEKEKTFIQTNMNKYQYNVLNNLSASIQGKSSFISTGDDALKTLEVVDMIEKGGAN